MRKVKGAATDEQKTAFLLAVLEAAEQRRRALESKDSLLLAANTFLSSVIVVHGLELLKLVSPYRSIYQSLIVIALLCFIASVITIFYSLIRISQKERSSFLDSVSTDRGEENNLFFYEIIAHSKKETYQQNIASLTKDEILHQLSSQVHNLARIIRRRTKILSYAIVFMGLGITSVSILLFVEIMME